MKGIKMSKDKSVIFLQEVCKELKNVRKDIDLSQEKVSNELGITKSYLSQIENGKRERISVMFVYRLTEFYGVPIEYVFKKVRTKIEKVD
ncbi:helix-turn-helix domain-containing protein [Staphylococcus equorum]|uniref:helix-turn-helix domain-containing protein n=1 Tax=Staphylococcus equorum TaxID=246432 RepID=UPI002407B995|nr:helix-turn-helix transcriptional regulator [Staphylococcus equorum]MDG0844442.1 helix-turn-helix domain-containing protein [Staphylococcus equorum]